MPPCLSRQWRAGTLCSSMPPEAFPHMVEILQSQSSQAISSTWRRLAIQPADLALGYSPQDIVHCEVEFDWLIAIARQRRDFGVAEQCLQRKIQPHRA